MADMVLTKTRLVGGVWEGVLAAPGGGEPRLVVTLLGQTVEGIETEALPQGGAWSVCIPIPAQLIAEGVQTFVISDAATGATLDSFALIAGEALGDDLRAEIDLLRAELDMLKRAFRRHCVETA